MNSKYPIWPKPESQILKDLVDSFRNRSKGVHYQVEKWTINCELDDGIERMNQDYYCHDKTDIRLSVWHDGILWLRVCRGSKNGWLFNYSFYGNLAENDSNSVVEALKKTFSHRENEIEVRKIWKSFGPYE